MLCYNDFMFRRIKVNNEVFFLSEEPPKVSHAGNKARLDIDCVIKKKNFTPYLCLKQHKFIGLFDKMKYATSFDYINRIAKLFWLNMKRVIIQYPVYADSITKRLVYRLIGRNEAVLIVHDVDSLRNFGKATLEMERNVLNSAKLLVVHNEEMKKSLNDLGIKTDMISLNLFDYLLDDVPNQVRRLEDPIVFAGNLDKSEFLKKTVWKNDMGIHVNLYGPNYSKDDYNENFIYRGCLPPNEVPFKIQGSFGLIWDGDSISTCSGAYGQYMKYNNPHKLSLYIAACLPIIVWKDAAIARFVEKEKIGFCISKISDISLEIKELDIAEYNKYLFNLKKLQNKVINGGFTNEALDKVERIFN